MIQKPPVGSQINWNHPLAKGLVSAVPLNEGAGNAYYDAATKEIYTAKALEFTPKGALPPAWITPPVTADYPWGGSAISNNNATAQSICSRLKDGHQFIENVKNGYSYAVLVQMLDNKTFPARIMDGTGPAVITIYQNVPRKEGVVGTTWRKADRDPIVPAVKYQLNEWILVLCTVQDGLGVMYINGKEVARDTHVNLAQSWANQEGQIAYNTTGKGGMMPNANFSSWWVWNHRVLTAQEAAQLYANPWAMFGPAAPIQPTTKPEPAIQEANKPAAIPAQWGPDIKLSTTETDAKTNENSGPCLAVSGRTLHVVWYDNKDKGSAIFYKHSTDGGATWSTDTRLCDYAGRADFPAVAVSGSTVLVTFRDYRNGHAASYSKRSLDGGETWEGDVFHKNTEWWPSCAAVGPNLYMALEDLPSKDNSEIYFRKSTDCGKTWDAIQQISNAPGRSEDPSISASGDYVHIAWNDNRTGIMQTFYRRSPDKGVTWGPETQLTTTTGFTYMPMLYADDSNVDLVWGDRRNGKDFELYHKHSGDFGLTWEAAECLMPGVKGGYPAIARDGKNVHIVWPGAGLFYLHSGDGGATWDPVVTLLPGAFGPGRVPYAFIAVSGPALHVIWADHRDGHGAIYYKSSPTANADTSGAAAK